jgi:hypothetical protein
MKIMTKKTLFGFAIVLVAYFSVYFFSVHATCYKSALPVTPWPEYVPFDGRFVHAVFAPAHFIDVAVFRRAYWRPTK